jgi:DNA replication protein DnaC
MDLIMSKDAALEYPTGTFLKASELNDKFTTARKDGRESRVITSLVKPACPIIDEIGRCHFDHENTMMFFDMIDRRYAKESPSTMIFTSNRQPSQWEEFFDGKDDLLATLDMIFDRAGVFMIKGWL